MSDTIEDIRARCFQEGPSRLLCYSDRIALLAEVDRLSDEIAVLRSYIDRNIRERDEARAKSAKMREALRKFECMCIGDQCDSYGQPYQPQCERYMARKLVEAKP